MLNDCWENSKKL